MASRSSRRRLSRRGFLGSSIGGAAGAVVIPQGGVFAAGSDAIRIGLVGCGGRGTGAVAQAAAAAEGVFVTAIGDVFADQAATAADLLSARLGHRFACPLAARFVGRFAAEAVLAAPLDAVVLATPPHLRPLHVARAVAAGLHVYCETPAAIDPDGVEMVLQAAARARAKGLSFVAGLPARHDTATAETVAHIHAGGIGTPLRGVAAFSGGLPWRRAAEPQRSGSEADLRNWIAHERFSGGPLLAHHLHALDRMLWAFGEASPAAALPLPETRPLPDPQRPGIALGVRYVFADGRSFDARLVRRAGIETEVEERVLGSAGTADLRPQAGPAVDPQAACAAAFVAAIRTGAPRDDSARVCRATLAALLGQAAARRGGPVHWSDLSVGGGAAAVTTATI